MCYNKTYRVHFTFLLFYIAEEYKMCLTSTYIFHQGLSSKETPEHITLNKSCNPQIKKIEVQTMNGRIYDPTIGQFLSPDNHVQLPDASLGFNRYSYALNNPLVFTDPSGESLLGILAWTAVATLVTSHVGGVIEAIRHGGINWHLSSQARQDAWTKADPFLSGTMANNYWAINRGLFMTDMHANGKTRFLRRSWQQISRFTWELPQTVAGYGWAQINNTLDKVDKVHFFHGATLIDTRYGKITSGLALGSYLFGKDMIPSYRDHRMIHEYGHYRQSQRWGRGYLSFIGIPSVSSVKLGFDLYDHKGRWFERRANILGAKYFDKHYGSGKEGFIEDHEDYFQKDYFYEGSAHYGNNAIPYTHPLRDIERDGERHFTPWSSHPKDNRAGFGTIGHNLIGLLFLPYFY